MTHGNLSQSATCRRGNRKRKISSFELCVCVFRANQHVDSVASLFDIHTGLIIWQISVFLYIHGVYYFHSKINGKISCFFVFIYLNLNTPCKELKKIGQRGLPSNPTMGSCLSSCSKQRKEHCSLLSSRFSQWFSWWKEIVLDGILALLLQSTKCYVKSVVCSS